MNSIGRISRFMGTYVIAEPVEAEVIRNECRVLDINFSAGRPFKTASLPFGTKPLNKRQSGFTADSTGNGITVPATGGSGQRVPGAAASAR